MSRTKFDETLTEPTATARQPAPTDPIVTERLTKYYGTKVVVNGLNLSVPKGSVYGFLGRNGAGKSTMIKMLTGMVHPDSGTARVLGEDSTDLRPQRGPGSLTWPKGIPSTTG